MQFSYKSFSNRFPGLFLSPSQVFLLLLCLLPSPSPCPAPPTFPSLAILVHDYSISNRLTPGSLSSLLATSIFVVEIAGALMVEEFSADCCAME